MKLVEFPRSAEAPFSLPSRLFLGWIILPSSPTRAASQNPLLNYMRDITVRSQCTQWPSLIICNASLIRGPCDSNRVITDSGEKANEARCIQRIILSRTDWCS
ncbi:hypothetical protein BDV33DRAFT_185792 [Aspergillus novoparasiticus]|uniref:Uncharacterized protein n=1 Tax=Aspergillus novoparasiticus TaxID=986946 RepID=A0A5N6E6R1_9EURO|nr:hypothetical protein BDV33DRAFT_185792 [Aspergillus novoparasiticus]